MNPISDAPITVVYERIEESAFADHVPAIFLMSIVAADLQKRIEAIERQILIHSKSSSENICDDTHFGTDGSSGSQGYDAGVMSDIREGFISVGDGIRDGVMSVGGSVMSLGKSAYRGVRKSVTGIHNEEGKIVEKDWSSELQQLKELQIELLVDEVQDLSSGMDSNGQHTLGESKNLLKPSHMFRPSAAKKKYGRRFMPLNCHSHQVQLGDGTLCAIVTSGAHCAHSLGFKHGGLLSLEKHAKLSNNSDELPLSIYHRLACCVSQSLTSMLTALAFDLANKAQDIRYWNLLRACGYLCHFECLLSTAGDENGMLDDHIVAIRTLERVSVEVFCGAAHDEKSNGHECRKPRVVSMAGSLSSSMVVRLDLGVPIAILGPNESKASLVGFFQCW